MPLREDPSWMRSLRPATKFVTARRRRLTCRPARLQETARAMATNRNAFDESRKLRLRGMSEGRVLTGPQTVHVDLANGCNTNCVTCWDHSPLLDAARSAAWKRKRVTFEDFSLLAADLASMNSVEAVILSGM